MTPSVLIYNFHYSSKKLEIYLTKYYAVKTTARQIIFTFFEIF